MSIEELEAGPLLSIIICLNVQLCKFAQLASGAWNNSAIKIKIEKLKIYGELSLKTSTEA